MIRTASSTSTRRDDHRVMRLAHNPLRRSERPPHTPDATMTLTEHLAELRQRIIRASLAVIVGMIAILAFYDQVLDFLLQPYDTLCQQRRRLLRPRLRAAVCRRSSSPTPSRA